MSDSLHSPYCHRDSEHAFASKSARCIHWSSVNYIAITLHLKFLTLWELVQSSVSTEHEEGTLISRKSIGKVLMLYVGPIFDQNCPRLQSETMRVRVKDEGYRNKRALDRRSVWQPSPTFDFMSAVSILSFHHGILPYFHQKDVQISGFQFLNPDKRKFLWVLFKRNRNEP